MSDYFSWETTTKSAEETEAIAEKLAYNLRGGEVIELVSDLGGGKTTFVRGLARGLGASDHVTSPTFKISNVYRSPKLTLQHFDFYRLNEPGIMAAEMAELLVDPSTVTVIEWADTVEQVLPKERLVITLYNNQNDQRLLTISYPDYFSYVMQGL